MQQVSADIDRRGAACLDTRKVTITLEFTPNEHGYISQTCYAKTSLPAIKYGGMGVLNQKTGKLESIIDGQLDILDESKNAEIINLKEGAAK